MRLVLLFHFSQHFQLINVKNVHGAYMHTVRIFIVFDLLGPTLD